MRTPIIAGNWKMYKTEFEALDFVRALRPLVEAVKDRTIVLCAPFTNLSKLYDAVVDTNLKLGGQNLYWENEGAFTGEISAPMLKAVGCTYVIIGHSERRQYFGETDETVNKKLMAALNHSLFPIVCFGETLEQREKGETLKVLENQIRKGLKNLETSHWEEVIIAYEPVWAIGTGKTASAQQAQEAHEFIRKLLPKEVAQQVRILYGGSVKPENSQELMAQGDIDGALVGGASLKIESFAAIVNYL